MQDTGLWDFLARNAAWIFSGAGVALITGAIRLTKAISERRRKRVTDQIPTGISKSHTQLTTRVTLDSQVRNEEETENPRIANLSTREIMNGYLSVPLLQRDHAASHYLGLRLKVKGKLYNSWSDLGTGFVLHLSSQPSVFLVIKPDQWPGVTLLHKGSYVEAEGPITEVSEFGITINPEHFGY